MKEKDYSELSQALRALAETDATREAEPRVETALLQAFRQQGQPEAVPAPVSTWSFFGLFAQRPVAWRFALATAALLLLGFGWFGWRAWQRTDAPQGYATNAPQPTPVPAPEPKTDLAQSNDRSVGQVFNLPAAPVNKKRKGQVGNLPHSVKAVPVEEEIATEFFPLVQQDVLPQRGQLRRVQVPRSTLINFGLPINAERIEFPINADLLVGEDGAARAIRFVQERSSDEAVIHVYGNSGRKAIPTSFRNLR